MEKKWFSVFIQETFIKVNGFKCNINLHCFIYTQDDVHACTIILFSKNKWLMKYERQNCIGICSDPFAFY